MLSCLTLKINCLSYAVLNIATQCNNNTKLPSNQTHIRFSSGEKMYEPLIVNALFVLDSILLEKLSWL